MSSQHLELGIPYELTRGMTSEGPSVPSSSSYQYSNHRTRNVLEIAMEILSAPRTPSVQEIVRAYHISGDDDRELLGAILNAKAAEDSVSLTTLQHPVLRD